MATGGVNMARTGRGRRAAALLVIALTALVTAGAARPVSSTGSDPMLDVAYYAVGSHSLFAFSLGSGGVVQGDSAVPAVVTLTSPPGFSADLSAPRGTEVGFVIGVVTAGNDLNSSVFGSGKLVVDDPAVYAASAAAQACAPGVHSAVWSVSFALLGQNVTIPVAVDVLAGASAATASFKLQFCPIVQPSPAFPLGLVLNQPTMLITDVVTGPTGPGDFVWNARIVPTASASSLTPSLEGTFDTRARVVIPHELTAAGRYDAPTHAAVITGRLTLRGRPRAGVDVSMVVESGGDVSFDNVTTTDAQGRFTFRRPISKPTNFQLTVDPETGPCQEASDAPAGCVSETLGSPPDVSVRVRPPRPTDPRLHLTAHDLAVANRSVAALSDLPLGWRDISIAGEPCEAFRPDLRRLTVTGQAYSTIFLSGKNDATFNSVASVFQTRREAVVAFDAIAQLDHARCEADALVDDDTSVDTVAKAGFLPMGDATRAFHIVWSFDDGGQLNGDLVFVRVGRAVLEFELLSEDGPRPVLLRKLIRTISARARRQ